MPPRISRKEVAYLLEALPDPGPGGAIAIASDPPEEIVEQVARRFPGSRIHAALPRAPGAGALATLPNVTASVSSRLCPPARGAADLAILRLSGFSGKQRDALLIQDASASLRTGGTLVLLTHKNRGAADQLAVIQQVFGNGAVARKGGGGIRVLTATKFAAAGSPAGPDQGTLLRETILGQELVLRTMPGVFSKDRLDLGTRALLEALPPAPAERILDLGCGYGAIGITLARLFPRARVTLVDVDAASVELARANVHLNGVEGNATVILSDGLAAVGDRTFDLALSHFPLHIPAHELRRIVREVERHLEPGGRLYGVALAAYDVRPIIADVFGEVETLPAPLAGDYHIVRAAKRR